MSETALKNYADENDLVDPAADPTLKDKQEAYEWLRSVAVSDSEHSYDAAVVMYEISRLLDE